MRLGTSSLLKAFRIKLLLAVLLCVGLQTQAQTCSTTQLGATCTRSGSFHGEILPNSGCGAFTNGTNYGPGRYFRVPVLLGGCYTVSTCGAPIDTQLGAFQGAATTGPFAYDDDNGPECTGTNASLVMVPNFTDYANVDVRQYNCLPGGTSSITVRLRQNNNLAITSSSADLCQGGTRALTATPARVSTSPQPNSGDVGTFTGTGVSGTTFTAPVPGTSQQAYSVTYTFGYCSTTQNINVFRSPSAAVAEADKFVCTGSANISATAPTTGTGSWSVVSGTGLSFFNANSPTTTVTGLPASGSVTLRWTTTNGPCATSSDDLVLTIGTTVGATAPATACEGNNAAFSASVTGLSDSLRWFRSTDGGTSWLRIGNGGGTTGATTSSLSYGPVVLAQNGNLFRLQAYACGSTTPINSASAALTIAREANVTGLGNTIPDGDITPVATDGTLFGSVATGGNLVRTFTIQNQGFTNLALSSIVSSSARFVVSNPGMPASLVPGASYSFTVTFSPNAISTFNATITVNNDDCFEAAYDFAVQGVGVAPQTRFYVDHTATGANNGTSWANAFTSFQSAVAVAVSGDTVLVAKGVHLPQVGAARKKKFTLVNGVRYYGGFPNGGGTFASRDFTANRTVLSGDIGAANDSLDNCFVVVDASNLSNATLMSGFTIERGNADSLGFHLFGQAGGVNIGASGGLRMDSLTLRNNFGRSAGALFGQGSTGLAMRGCTVVVNNSLTTGGVFIDTGTFTVLNSQFQSNKGSTGGAMQFNGAATLTNVSFLNNRATANGGAVSGGLGSVFIGCNFTGNISTGADGGALYRGSGASTTFIDCAFLQNSATRGGAINSINGGVSLTRCLFRENQATTNHGGAFYNNIATSTLTNCVFWKNASLTGTGGAIFNNTGGTCNIHSCTFNGNTATVGTGGLTNNSTSNANITNSIFWGNLSNGNDAPATSEIVNGSGTLTVSNTIWQGATPSGTIYNCNPYFIDPAIGDLRLQTCSNAIELGTATGAPATDILGSARPFDGDAMGGAGYDLGAYESQAVCNPVVWYVDLTAVGCNNGRYWADAFTDLKSALRVAGAGDSILVATGTYKPDQGTNSRDSAFVLKSNITLLGGFPTGGAPLSGRNWTANPTRLSGAVGTAAATDNSYHVLKANNVSGTTLDGFFVQDGYANGAAAADQQGGGLTQIASYVVSRFVSFENNFASVRGGGAYHDAGGNPTYNNVRFVGNSSDKGGAAYFTAASFVRNAIFRNNSATTYGGGLCMVVNQNVNQSTFKDNNAPAGAGVYFEGGGSNKLHNCILWGNTGGQDVQGVGQIEVRSSIIEDGTPANCVGCNQVSTSNPLFTNADGQLSACSPAVDLGNATLPNLPAIDFLGNARPLDGDGLNGAAYDLGAFESTALCNVTRLYVDSSAVTGLNLGNSWPNAYLSLQSAIANAGPGDTIWVAKGNYFPSVPAGRGATFVLNDGVKIYGGFPSGGSPFNGRNAGIHLTVLNGDIGTVSDSLDNTFHVVTVASGATSSALLDGFFVTKGLANGGGTNNFGGGIYCINAAPRLNACQFLRNTAASGGGGYFENSNALLTASRFERNWGRGSASANGAGVAIAGTAGADFVRCLFVQNRVINSGGTGGAVTIDLAIGTNFSNCEFLENRTNNGQGGAVRVSQGSATAFFTNCLFRGNNAGTNEGGALYADLNCSATLNSCTFYGHINASNFAVVAGNSGANVTANNSIFGTTSDQAFRAAGTLTLNACVYPVGTCPAGATCTNLYPVAPGFVAAPGNLRLAPSSPAINIGSNAFVPLDAFDVDGDLDIIERTPDLDLNPRLFGANVDIGAYELQCTPAVVSTQPTNANVCPNGNASFSTTVTNAADSLRWQVSTNGGSTWANLSNGAPISGATTATLTINPAAASLNGYQYRLLVYSCGALSSTSSAATLNSADLVPPTALCAPATLYLGAGGTVPLAATQVNNGSNDNCSAVSLSVSPSSFACAQIGAQNVTLTVTDASSNASTCSAIVTVLDTVRPVIVCANPTVYLNSAGLGSLSAAAATASATDNCGVASSTVNPNSFDCSDAFSNRLIWSAQTNLRRARLNGSAQQDFLSFASTQITMAYVPGKDSIYMADFTARKIQRVHVSGGPITDIKTNVDPFGIAVDPIAGKIYWADPNANTISRCDLNGANTQVIVTGTANTDFTRMIKLDLLHGKMYWTDANQGFIKRANLDGTGIQTLVTGMGNIVGLALDPVGNKMYYSSYSFNDIRRANLDGTGVAVIVPSTTLPLGIDLDLINGKVYWANGSGSNLIRSANLNGSGVTTVASGIPTPYDVAVIPPTPATLTVTDGSGNSATCTALVTVQDTIRPTAVCQPATVVLNAAGTGTLAPAAVNNGSSDACGIFGYSLSTTSFTCANVGANTVTLSATDPSGNVGTCTATVTVLDQTAPTAICQNATVALNASGTASITPAMVNNGSSDACGAVTLSVSPNTFGCIPLGNRPVTLTVTDQNGNTSTCSATVNVVDNLAPQVICQNLTVYLNTAGSVSITALAVGSASTDNCGINSRSVAPSDFFCANVGANTVTFVANDQAGNTSTCNATVTVLDTIDPIALCLNTTLYLNASGTATLSPAAVNDGSFDVCGIGNQMVSPNNFGCAQIGSNAVTLTVSDPSGNSSTCAASVTVLDTVRPTAVCQPVTAYLDNTGSASISPAQVNAGSTDACGIATIGVLPNTFTCSALGANVVTLSLVDQFGNASSCSATVTVLDTVRPVAVCTPATVTLDANGNGGIGASVIGLGSSDNCTSFTASLTPNTFTCANLGANTVTLTLVDGSGNTSTCQANVTVQDVTPPVVVCTPATIFLDAAGNGVVGGSVIGLGTSDACGIFTPSLSQSSFTCAHVGSNSVVFTATDPSGNTASCTTTVTVLDTVRPVLVCQPVTVHLGNTGTGSVSVAQVGATVSDACGIASSSVSPSTFGCANVGANTVTLTATDNNGNTASCTAVVTVLDTVDPVVLCQPVTVHLNNAGAGSVSVAQVAASISDACGIASSTVSPSTFGCANVGANTVTLTATDNNGNSASCAVVVTVLDTVDPVIVCQPVTVHLDNVGAGSVSVAQVGATISDACGIASSSVSPSAFGCANIGANTVTLTATDNNGNTASCTAVVTVLDTIAPALTCQGLNVYLDNNGNGSVSVGQVGSAINDACGIASSSVSPSTFGCANIGANTVTLSATDNNGNSASCTAVVTVLDTIDPVVLCQPVTVHLSNTGTGSVSVAQVSAGISDACGIASSAVSPSAFSCANVGANTVTLTATDNNGNSAFCTAVVTVLDTVDPVVLCQPATVYLDASGNGFVSVSQVDAGTSDACGIAFSSVTPSPFNCLSVGANTVTLSSTDVNGNSASCTATVTVLDTIAPALTCQGLNVYLDNNGNGSVGVGQVGSAINDACGIASSSVSPSTFGCANSGANTVTLSATDNNGNSASCTGVVTVLDTIDPVVLCQPVTVHLSNTGTGSVSVAQVSAGISDACGIASSAVSPSAFSCANVGANTVTLTATDNNGNSAFCTAVVTVLDTVDPVVLCQPATVYLDASGNGFVSVSQVDAGTSDACGIAFSSVTPSPFNCLSVGANTVTLSSTDVNGNSASCTATVTVLDTIAPALTCQGLNVYLDNNGNGSVSVGQVGSAINDACGIASSSVSPSTFGCANIGANTVTLNATDNNGNSASCTAVVTVLDTIDPVVLCQPVTVHLSSTGTGSVSVAQVSAGISDACGIASSAVSPSAFGCANVGANSVTLTATDNNGSSASCTAVVTVLDTVDPVVVCQPVTIHLGITGTGSVSVAQVGVSISDACGIASSAVSPASFGCNNVGANTVTLSATDNNGNSAACTAIVTVLDTIDPVVVCQPVTVQLGNTGTSSVSVAQVGATVSDACGIASSSVSPSTFGCANVGANTVTLTATDNNGNTASCSAVITVLDTVDPVVLCQPVTVHLDNAGAGSVSVAQVAANISDACGIASSAVSPSTFGCANVGANTVTLTATDNNGNIASCTAIVTVLDTVDPVVLCQADTLYLNSLGNGTLSPSQVSAGSSDACGATSLSVSPAAFTCTDVGVNNVVLTATDGQGNSSTCATTVMVLDTVSPNAICQFASIFLDASGTVTIPPARINANSNDACGIDTLIISQGTFNCSNLGTNTVTLIVIDVNGNTDICNTVVVVRDTIRPAMVCQPATVYLDISGNGSITPAAIDGGSFDACGIASLTASATSFTCAQIGSNTVTLTATDIRNNSASCVTTVTVLDTVRPTAICQPSTLYLDGSGQAAITSSAVDGGSSDACGIATQNISPSNFGCAQVGANPVTLSLTDNHGNTQQCVATVTVLDTIRPTALCQALTVYLDTLGTVTVAATNVDAGSADACGIASQTLSPANFGCAEIGSNAVTLSIQDNHGNSQQCSTTVTVLDTVRPTAICQPISLYLDASGAVTTTATAVNNGSQDACGLDTLILSTTSFGCGDVGSQALTLLVLDQHGNAGTCTSIATIQDTIAPALACQNATLLLGTAGQAILSDTAITTWVSDACGLDTILLSQDLFACGDTGQNVVTLTALDIHGNARNCTVVVTVVPDPFTVQLAAVTQSCGYSVSCAGAQDGAAQATPGGGCAPYTYSWSTGGNGAQITGVGAGTYWVTVTDAIGRVWTDSVLVTAPDPLQANANAAMTVCAGDTNGYVDLTPSGGNGCQGYSFLWHNGATTEDLTGMGAGTWSVTVTDPTGCQGQQTGLISSIPAPQPNLGPDILKCAEDIVTLNPGGYFAYLWSVGSTANTATVGQPGTYWVLVTDSVGCAGTDSITVTNRATQQAFIQATGPTPLCIGDTAVLDAGAGFSSYLWSTGATTPAIVVTNGTATFTVTATDNFGCLNVDSSAVIFNNAPRPNPVIQPNGPVSLCAGSTLVLDASLGYFSYAWSNGGSTSQINVSAPGTYGVTVSNGFGCTGSAVPVTVVQLPAPQPTVTFSNDTLWTDPTWSSFQWYFNGAPIPGAVLNYHVPALDGIYTVVVTDLAGCEGISPDINVQLVAIADDRNTIHGLSLYPNPARGNFFLTTLRPIDWNLTVTITDMFGRRIKSYQMAHLVQDTGFDISELAAGPYLVEIETQKGQRKVFRLVVQ